ncbi:MAG: hypothetical protein JWR16_2392 [Nevskia sp.]|nr:hypothetical protein [Nevskia sp.]
MKIVASAPGKVVLLGEYAVLEGAPALSMAVDRRAVARITPRLGSRCEVQAPDILSAAAALTFSADGAPQWSDGATAASLALVDQVLRGLAHERALPTLGRGFALQLDTSAFFDQVGSERLKLGLGSSAALTVALASALVAHFGRGAAAADRRVWLERLLHIHREFQSGHGSGVDVATSLVGGLIEYRLSEGGTLPQARAARWPQALHYCFVWSGRSASTPQLLATLQAWSKGHAADYAARIAELSAIAEAGIAAVRSDNAAALLQTAAAYAAALRLLGAASGVGIFSAEHLRLAELARLSGVVYKSCGAGGGDVGVAFALDPQGLQHYASALAQEGFLRVPMAVDEGGLRLEFTEIDEV